MSLLEEQGWKLPRAGRITALVLAATALALLVPYASHFVLRQVRGGGGGGGV